MQKLVDWWLDRVRTARGVITTGVAALIAAWSVSAGLTNRDPLPVVTIGSVIVFAFYWVVLWFVVGWVRKTWERRTRPGTPSYARPIATLSSRSMLREDKNAGFFRDRRGFLFRQRFWFIGTGCPPTELYEARYKAIQSLQGERPVPIASLHGRTWWFFEGTFYWENEGYESADVKALIRQRERQKQRKLEHARALLTAEEETSIRKREGIPLEVRRAVWARDGGRCVECGRAEVLEYDHIIPVTMGGSSTEKNLQLLCADCNRAKGANL